MYWVAVDYRARGVCAGAIAERNEWCGGASGAWHVAPGQEAECSGRHLHHQQRHHRHLPHTLQVHAAIGHRERLLWHLRCLL